MVIALARLLAAPNYRTELRQTTERNCAKLPNGTACDAVVHLRNGTYGLIEIKLGGESLVEEGAATLNGLAAIVDPTKMKTPAFKMVLTAVGDVVYRRTADGVIVCPIAALRP
jgi:hypothetical protein